MLNYSDNAIVFDWEILNNKQDIGKWEMLFEEENKKINGNGMSEFLETITQLPQDQINVIFINNLNMFELISSSYMSYQEDFKAVVRERGINFFYLKPFDFVEFRNSNNFWGDISVEEFLKRLTLCRDYFKLGRKNKLSLKKHFRFTLTKEIWSSITEKYYLNSKTFKQLKEDLLPKTPEELDLLLNAYKASFIYANPNYLNKTICDVYSSDIKSSHTGLFCRKRYPYGEGTVEEDPMKIYEIMNGDYYTWIGKFKIIGLREKIADFPWDMRNFGYQAKDGSWIVTLLAPHWQIFKRIYGADNLIPIEFVYYQQKVLEKNYILMMIDLYREKEYFKTTEAEDWIKGLFKQRTELPYGQSIKNPVYYTGVIYDYEENEFIIDRLPPQTFEDKVKQLRKHSLPFQYGLWTAAYSWAEEVGMIIDIGLDKVIYGDTDSVKFIGEEGLEVVKRHNKEIDKEFDFVRNRYNLIVEIDSKLGRWHDDGFNVCFKTLGMKRYLSFKDCGTLKATCSGAIINTLQDYVDNSDDPFEEFDKEMTITGLYKHVSMDKKRRTVHVSYGDHLEDV